MERHILHVDMDAFYASVEQHDDPSLRRRPVVVGHSIRGVVTSASYEARQYGIRSAMPIAQARRRCAEIVEVPVRMSRYAEVSRQIMAIFSSVSPLVEPVSIDEAFLDVSGSEQLFGSAEEIAKKIKIEVHRATGLTCSVGVAPTKYVAKIASDLEKPDGLTVITAIELPGFLADLPVGKLPGIGPAAQQRLHGSGIDTVDDLIRLGPDSVEKRLGKLGVGLLDKICGKSDTPVVRWSQAKSNSAENTFAVNTRDRKEIEKWLLRQSDRVAADLRHQGLLARRVTVKLKDDRFEIRTRSRSLPHPTDSTAEIFAAALALFSAVKLNREIRLVGVGVSNFIKTERQLSLFEDKDNQKQRLVDQAVDKIREKFGRNGIHRGSVIDIIK